MTDFRRLEPANPIGEPIAAIRIHQQASNGILERDVPVAFIRMIEGQTPKKDRPQCRIWIDGITDPMHVMETRDEILGLIQATQRPWIVTFAKKPD